ncbi:MAG: amidohydrolase [candidate division WOR-3 bacterium]
METLSGYLIPTPSASAFPGKIIIDNGKIAALVPSERCESDNFILPGFIDSHTHPIEYGLTKLFPDLSPARSVNEVLELLSEALNHKAELPLLIAFNFDPDQIREHRYLYRRELDRLTRTKPIFVYRTDGHSGIANTPALHMLSLQLPEGIEFDGAGNPTGLVFGPAYELLSSRMKRQLPTDVLTTALRLTAKDAAQAGITTMAAMVGTPEMAESEWQIILNALECAEVRMVPFMQTWNVELACQFKLSRIGGCLLLDGSFGSHTAALSDEYADVPGFSGILYHSDSKILEFLCHASRLNLQTAFHAIGDRAIEQLVRCHEQLVGQTAESLRHRIEHAELLTPELINRISKLKLILCVQPAFELLWGGPSGMYAKRLGERWRMTNPYRTLFKSGVVVAGGADAPVTPLNPLFGIRAATSLPNMNERLSSAEALALFTANAAYSLKMEDRIGSLKPGMEADLVITSADPRIDTRARIIATFRAGKVIYQADLWQ